MKTGFVGLGSMGSPMAVNLLRAGHELTVFNRTRSRAEELAGEGARVADSPADAARNAEALITMLADDHAVEEVLFNGVIGGLRRGAIHISMSTISVACSKRLAGAHRAAGQFYVAAPVFGRPDAAAAAKLWVVAAGPPEQIGRCRPLFDAIGQGVFVVGGEPSAANVVKLAGNFMLASMLETLGEAVALARKSGVDARRFLEIMTGTLFKSPAYETYGTLIAEERFEPAGFRLRLGLKDVKLALGAADGAAVPMPLASLVRDHLLSAVARGYGDKDWSALARVIAENAGLS